MPAEVKPASTAPTLADLLADAYRAAADDREMISAPEGALTGEKFHRSVDALRARLRSTHVTNGEPVLAVATGSAPTALVVAHAALAEGWAYSVRSPHWPLPYQRAAAERVPPDLEVAEAEILTVAQDGSDSAGQPRQVPDMLLSHLLFTSGSTGAPRAIGTERRALAHHLTVLRATFGLGRSDVVLQLAPPHLDASLRDLLYPSLCGTRIVVGRRRDSRVDIVSVARQIIDRQVTHILSVLPSVLFEIAAQLSEQGWQAPLVRQIAVSGEALAPRALSSARRAFPHAEVVNQYGPSETTMTATRVTIAPGQVDDSDGAHVGHPHPGYRLRVQDGDAIRIGGPGVARGYIGDPRATAAVFLPEPGGRGAREYDTGDIGELTPDGTLVLSGRSDDQVKVLGHKFSVSAVAAALEALAPVRRAAALWVTEAGQQPRLVAFVVSHKPGTGSADYQRALAGHIPNWMLPNAIEVLDDLPLLANGKLDRKALLATLTAAPADGPASRPVAAPAEALHEIWSRLLRRRDFGGDDDFFLMGGNSLLALKAISQSRAVVPELTVKAFFAEPTINSILRLRGVS
jgi:acyl-coenzyme A synthetase/AMP-(fatty) acid ligase